MQKQPSDLVAPGSSINLHPVHIPLSEGFPITDVGPIHYPDSSPLTMLHYHDSLEIGYCHEGSGVFIINDKIIPFSQGCASIIFKNQLHIAKSNPDNPGGWHFINLDPFRLLNGPGFYDLPSLCCCLEADPPIENILTSEEGLPSIVLKIIQELVNKQTGYKPLLQGLVLELLIHINRRITRTECHSNFQRTGMIALSPAFTRIFSHYHQGICVTDLAKCCNMSLTHFRRVFKDTMGVSPLEYIHQLRIRMATVLLAGTQQPILDISLQVGYDSLSSFNRQFMRIMNICPRDWRKICI